MIIICAITLLICLGLYEQRFVLTSDNPGLYKSIKVIDASIGKGVDIIFLILLLISAWSIYDSAYVFNHSALGDIIGYKPTKDNIEVLKELSDDVVAWITIDNTTIDYPIMQGEDNSVYLNRDPYGKYNLSGSIFLDSNNKSDFSDDYSLIYGHHMAQGLMFGAIDAWEEKSYFNDHLDGELILIDGTVYKFKIFAYMRVDASNDEIFIVGDKYTADQRITFTKKSATHYNEPKNKQLVYLSTCASPLSTERIVLAGYIYK